MISDIDAHVFSKDDYFANSNKLKWKAIARVLGVSEATFSKWRQIHSSVPQTRDVSEWQDWHEKNREALHRVGPPTKNYSTSSTSKEYTRYTWSQLIKDIKLAQRTVWRYRQEYTDAPSVPDLDQWKSFLQKHNLPKPQGRKKGQGNATKFTSVQERKEVYNEVEWTIEFLNSLPTRPAATYHEFVRMAIHEKIRNVINEDLKNGRDLLPHIQEYIASKAANVQEESLL